MLAMAEKLYTRQEIADTLHVPLGRVGAAITFRHIKGQPIPDNLSKRGYTTAQVQEITGYLAAHPIKKVARHELYSTAMHEAFMENVALVGTHWMWQGARQKREHTIEPIFRVGFEHRPGFPYMPAQRWIYGFTHGPLYFDQIVRETCGEPMCVNPEHLVAVKRDPSQWNKGRRSITHTPLSDLRRQRDWTLPELRDRLLAVVVIPPEASKRQNTASVMTISNWEYGVRPPPPWFRDALAKLYTMTPDNLDRIIEKTGRTYHETGAIDAPSTEE